MPESTVDALRAKADQLAETAAERRAEAGRCRERARDLDLGAVEFDNQALEYRLAASVVERAVMDSNGVLVLPPPGATDVQTGPRR